MDLRTRIVRACEKGAQSQEAIALQFGVSYPFVKKMWRQWRETGDLQPGKMGGHRPRAIRGRALERLKGAVEGRPDATLEELREACGARCSLMTMSNTLKRLGYRRKKNAARQ